jgi:hypothetical protein
MLEQSEARIRGEVALEFVEGLRQQGCTQTFNFLHNLAQFDKAAEQSMYLDVIADCHDLPQLPEEVKAGLSCGQVNHGRAVYFAFDGIYPEQICVAALVKPLGGRLQSDFLTFSAAEAREKSRIMARIAERMPARAVSAPV